MPPRAIPASFWRGGTSRGLLLRASTLSSYPPSIRDSIIYTALGSPDPDGRQISGLGGGVSSLSKVGIIGAPGEGLEDQKEWGRLPGVDWADEGKEGGKVAWDVVYRFGQVGVRTASIDWTTTCGNLLSSVALSSLTSTPPILPYSTLFTRSRSLPSPSPNQPLYFPLRILAAATGDITTVKIPLDPQTLMIWEPIEGDGTAGVIAGVPGEEAKIWVELPIETEGEGKGLCTGRVKDTVEWEGEEIEFSLVSTGLPNIFLPLSSLPSSILSLFPSPSSSSSPSPSSNPLTLPSSILTSPSLLSLLDSLRTKIAQNYSLPLSLASPKIILISSIPEEGYQTSSGEKVEKNEGDLLVRSISSGDWHASIPGTTLGALNLAAGIEGTVVHSLLPSSSESEGEGKGQEKIVTIRAAHIAGVSESSVKFNKEGKGEAVVMMRTAREIMRGEVMVPERVFEGMPLEEA